MKYRIEVDVMPKSEISDPQGQTIERALPTLGFKGIHDVRVGKHISLVVDADSESDAVELARRAAEKFLSNPVIEEFEVNAGISQ